MSGVDNHIKIYRGDTKVYTVYFFDEDERLDLADFTIRFTVKENKTDTDESAIISVEGVVAEADEEFGIATISLTKDDTDDLTPGDYYYDIQLSNNETEVVYTVRYGLFTVIADITRTSLSEE